jgi:hypothetical protein
MLNFLVLSYGNFGSNDSPEKIFSAPIKPLAATKFEAANALAKWALEWMPSGCLKAPGYGMSCCIEQVPAARLQTTPG